jgi:hypothetical protein
LTNELESLVDDAWRTARALDVPPTSSSKQRTIPSTKIK